MSESLTETETVTDTESPGTARPRRILAAAVLTGLEGLVVAGFGVVSLVMLVTGKPDDMTQAATLAVTVLALSALPLAAARGLWLRRRWSRGPSMIVQLIALPVSWTMVQNGGALTAAAVATAVAAVAVLVCLVNPTATQALGIGPRN
ncbi:MULTISPECIES: hypothetical protein [unclassified Streptomyces]|uniref:hypothetical protein n=1 Tax=unclassified Streptomyces TaxID=2593676 RepID=UPI002DDB6B05|nr:MULTISPECIES: hypothetical protein [unclassified Streptomyces]WSA92447.1 hypothetical protein OIE63_13405 [Streptomyces sp. NBC_01795]WSB76813.1 hypothetical protein OHB04_14210 [Streptomyces sp. NBC_01775]WSS43757.1 hypothetical protein OG220_26550 [Streptomyces sp. NBC_01187]